MQHVCTCMWVCVCVQIDGYILVPSLMCSRSVISVRQIFAEWLTSLMHHSMTWVFNQDCIAHKKRNRPRDSGIMASLPYLRRLKQTDTHTHTHTQWPNGWLTKKYWCAALQHTHPCISVTSILKLQTESEEISLMILEVLEVLEILASFQIYALTGWKHSLPRIMSPFLKLISWSSAASHRP